MSRLLRGSGARPGRRFALSRAFTLIEMLVVMAIMSVMLVLAGLSFTTISSSMDVSNSVQNVTDALNLARQIALSRNEYTQVRFFSLPQSVPNPRDDQFTAVAVFAADSPLYESTGKTYAQWTAARRFRPENAVAMLPGNCVVVNDAASTYSSLLNSKLLHTGTMQLPDNQTYNWVGFYFKPDGSIDVPPPATSLCLSICSYNLFKAAQKSKPGSLPANYAVIMLDPINGRFQVLRP